jgi:uncharacterized membrane protein
MKKELNVLIVLALIWCMGFVAAPLVSHSLLSKVLYRFFSVVCHQFGSRSFHLHGEPFAVCIRCTSIYAGFLTSLLFVRYSAQLRSKKFDTAALLLICSLPMVFDGFASLLNLRDSTMLSRIVTGLLFGVGMALLMHQSLTEITHTLLTTKIKRPWTRNQIS